MVDSTTFSYFYKPKVRILALNLNCSLIASSMIALFPSVLDVAVSRVWTCSSGTQAAVRASTCEQAHLTWQLHCILTKSSSLQCCCPQGTAGSAWHWWMEQWVCHPSPHMASGWMPFKSSSMGGSGKKVGWWWLQILTYTCTPQFKLWLWSSEVSIKLHLDC